MKIIKILALPLRYKKSIWYLIREKGLKSVINFLLVKYCIPDEGGEYSILNPLLTKFPFLTPYPFKIEVEHSTICDKRCIICEHTYWTEKSERYDFEKFKMVIDQFPNLKWINITGEGSSFLNPDFIKMLEYLSLKDVSINFVDEFDFIDEEKARKLINLRVNCIWVSMDGATKETYEKIKVGCDFDKAISNIKRMLELKKELGSPFPTICFRFIVNKLNYVEIPKMVELVHSLGDLGEGSKLEFAGILKFKEIEDFYMPEIPENIVDEALEKAKNLKMRVTFCHAEEEKLPSITRCGAWAEPYILMGGYVLPCCAVLMSNKRDFLRKYAFGNLFEKPFKEIWYSERYRKFRSLVPRKKGEMPILCANCRAYNTEEREKKYGISREI